MSLLPALLALSGLWAAAPTAGAPPPPAATAVAHVAVAANFAGAFAELARAFSRETGHRLLVSSGSTGKLASQIENGAPFDVLLAADASRPARLEGAGLAVAGSRFTYAVGRLVLWSRDPALVDPQGKVLASGRFHHLAIANPENAPYGAAARDVLTKLGLWQPLQPLLVTGEDIGQTFQFVASGGAELGFIALSQLRGGGGQLKGSSWIVPAELYQPLEQQTVLLTHGRDNPAAAALLAFLRGAAARTALEALGYRTP